MFQCLAEESAEIIQAISKIQRFGLDDNYPGYGDNLERLVLEVNDFFAVLEMVNRELAKAGYPWVHRNSWSIIAKTTKVEKFIAYAKERGTITE